jgi:hypothetical protein
MREIYAFARRHFLQWMDLKQNFKGGELWLTEGNMTIPMKLDACPNGPGLPANFQRFFRASHESAQAPDRSALRAKAMIVHPLSPALQKIPPARNPWQEQQVLLRCDLPWLPCRDIVRGAHLENNVLPPHTAVHRQGQSKSSAESIPQLWRAETRESEFDFARSC